MDFFTGVGNGFGAWGKTLEDMFTGETIGTPKKSDFQYGGQGEGYFQGLANAQAGQAAPQADLTGYNQMRGMGLSDRGQIGGQISALQAMVRDPNASPAQQQ